MISVQNLSKKFGALCAIDSLSLEVQRGEIFGIVGPDGAGKSSLLRILSGILTPDSGEVRVNGIDVLRHPYKVKEQIAYMPQRFGLYEDLSVEENIFFFGRLFGESGRSIRKSLPRLYDFSRLDPFRNRLAGRLSGGMKQKLGLVCCLIHKPEILLLDEPTNGVDPVSRREFWKILYALLAQQVTIVVSTAYLDEAERCNRIAMMHGGRIIKEGSPLTVKKSVGETMLVIRVKDVWNTVQLLKAIPEGASAFYEGEVIKIFTRDKAACLRSVKSFLKKRGIDSEITEAVPSLENSFIYYVTRGAV